MRAAFFFLLCGCVLSGCQSLQQDTAAPRNHGFDNMLESVVRLDVWETTFEGGTRRTAHGVGSGVIMTPGGHILTNAHVVNPYAERILVTLNSLERVPAHLIGWDHWTDLAVLRLDMDEVNDRGLVFSHANYGRSAALAPGQTVYAAGTPHGLTRTLTRGIVSNTNRFFEGAEVAGGYETGLFNTWLQTDAAINPGNSGGPLALPDGAVVGINTRSYLGANNLSFAVPADIAQRVATGLIKMGTLTRSYVGIEPAPLQDLEDFFDLDLNEGVLIQSIDPGSPAARANLRPGDILLRINGETVDGRFPEQLPGIRHKIARLPVGSTVTLDLKRGDRTFSETLVTEQLESRVGRRDAFADWGLSVQELSRPIARERQLDSADGVLIVGVQPGFPATKADLRPGDIIVGVNREPLEGIAQLRSFYENYAKAPANVLFEINRNHQVLYVVLKP